MKESVLGDIYSKSEDAKAKKRLEQDEAYKISKVTQLCMEKSHKEKSTLDVRLCERFLKNGINMV